MSALTILCNTWFEFSWIYQFVRQKPQKVPELVVDQMICDGLRLSEVVNCLLKQR